MARQFIAQRRARAGGMPTVPDRFELQRQMQAAPPNPLFSDFSPYVDSAVQAPLFVEGSVTKEVYVPAPLRQAGVRVVVQWGRYDAWLGAQSDAGDEARARQALELLKRQALRHPVPYVSPKEVVEAFARSGSLCMRHIGQAHPSASSVQMRESYWAILHRIRQLSVSPAELLGTTELAYWTAFLCMCAGPTVWRRLTSFLTQDRYSERQLTLGQTENVVFNSAQQCLVQHGLLPAPLRLVWTRLLFYWHANTEHALSLMLRLLSTYLAGGPSPGLIADMLADAAGWVSAAHVSTPEEDEAKRAAIMSGANLAFETEEWARVLRLA